MVKEVMRVPMPTQEQLEPVVRLEREATFNLLELGTIAMINPTGIAEHINSRTLELAVRPEEVIADEQEEVIYLRRAA